MEKLIDRYLRLFIYIGLFGISIISSAITLGGYYIYTTQRTTSEILELHHYRMSGMEQTDELIMQRIMGNMVLVDKLSTDVGELTKAVAVVQFMTEKQTQILEVDR